MQDYFFNYSINSSANINLKIAIEFKKIDRHTAHPNSAQNVKRNKISYFCDDEFDCGRKRAGIVRYRSSLVPRDRLRRLLR